jgi:hypothetical protein
MNYQMIDLLDKAVDQNLEDDKETLMREGVLTFNDRIVINKLNLMSGAYSSKLIDYIKGLYQQNQYMGIYYFLLNLITALEMDIPYLYMQLPSNIKVLQLYIGEVIADMKECIC